VIFYSVWIEIILRFAVLWPLDYTNHLRAFYPVCRSLYVTESFVYRLSVSPMLYLCVNSVTYLLTFFFVGTVLAVLCRRWAPRSDGVPWNQVGSIRVSFAVRRLCLFQRARADGRSLLPRNICQQGSLARRWLFFPLFVLYSTPAVFTVEFNNQYTNFTSQAAPRERKPPPPRSRNHHPNVAWAASPTKSNRFLLVTCRVFLKHFIEICQELFELSC